MADKEYAVSEGGTYGTVAAALAQVKTDGFGDLTTYGCLQIPISGAWTAADTAQIDFDGFTTDATHYINIYTAGLSRHAGVWSSTRYVHASNNITYDTLLRSAAYVRFDGILFTNTNPSAGHYFFTSYGLTTTSDIRVSNCIFKGHGSATYRERMLAVGTGSFPTLKMWNCLFYNFGDEADSGFYATADMSAVYVYRSVFKGSGNHWYGFRQDGGGMTLKNCYSGGNGVSDYLGSITMTTCASSDHTGSDEALHAIAVDTDTFVNVTAGSEDFHLAADGLSPLQGVGTNTSGDAAPFNDPLDIDGDTIVNWSIGADDGTAGAGLSRPLTGVCG